MKPFILQRGILVAAACAICTTAWAGSPRVSSVYPAAGQRGSEIEVECRGSNLEDATGIIFDEPGFVATSVLAEKGKFKVSVKLAADARLGEHRFRVVTATGLSDVRLFYVSPFPIVPEVEATPDAKSAVDQPQAIALGTSVSGKSSGEDQDRFEVELKKGQRLSAEVIGARLQTQPLFDPAVIISKADGTKLIEADDGAFTRQDPVTSIIAPEDGKYIVTVKEATNSGQGECQYLLNVGSFPRPVAVYPPGGQVGEDLKIQLLGDASGPIEKTIKLPDQPQEQFAIYPEDGQPAPQPNMIRVSNFPNVLEAEPNNDPATAPATDKALPLAFNGIIQEKGDVDSFKFTAKKGQVYDFNVYARRLRSPLDSFLTIHDAKGNQLANNDDAGRTDSYLRWKAPEDGTFEVTISDQLLRGGPNYTYRVEVDSPVSRVDLWLPEMVANSNQERRAIVVPKGNRYASLVRAKRNDFGGDLQLVPQDLPPGITVTGVNMDKSVDTVAMVFEAAPDAASDAKLFAFGAKWVDAPKDAAFTAAIDHNIDVSENGNQQSYYSIKEDKLPMVVTNEIPVTINLMAPKVTLLQNGSLNLKVIAERKNDFKGPISLDILYTPPGFGSAGTVVIKEGETEANYTISANGTAPLKKWPICIVGSADFGKGVIWMSTQLVDVEVTAPFVSGQIVRTFVDQGDSTNVTVKLENKIPFEGTAKISLLGLPANTTAPDKEITKDDKEVVFSVKAEATAPAASHKQLFCQFKLTKDGETMTSAFANGGILRVDKATLAKKEEASK